AVLDFLRLDAIVERAMAHMADVREPVPLAALLGVVIVERIVVTQQTELVKLCDVVPGGRAPEQRRLRVVDSSIEPEDFALLHQARRIDDSLGTEEIETSHLVVVAEHTPRRFLRRAGFDRQLGIARKFIWIFHFSNADYKSFNCACFANAKVTVRSMRTKL